MNLSGDLAIPPHIKRAARHISLITHIEPSKHSACVMMGTQLRKLSTLSVQGAYLGPCLVDMNRLAPLAGCKTSLSTSSAHCKLPVQLAIISTGNSRPSRSYVDLD